MLPECKNSHWLYEKLESRHNGGSIKGPLKSLNMYDVREVSRRPSIGPP